MTVQFNLLRPFSTFKIGDKLLLKELQNLVDELKGTNSVNSKIEIIKKKPELRPILETIYSPDVRFHVTSKSLSGENDLKSDLYLGFEDCLKNLSSRQVTGRAAVSLVKESISLHPEFEDLIKNIIDKNLKARIRFDLIKKSFDSCSTSNIICTLGFSIEKHLEYLKKSLSKGQEWFISRKYDGIRTFLVYNHLEKTVTLLSRNIKAIKGINPKIIEAILTDLSGIEESFVLDGELVYMAATDGGKEDFSKTVSIVKSLEAKPIDGLEFRIFDEIIAEVTFGKRFEKIKQRFAQQFKTSKFLKMVEQNILKNFEDFDYEKMIENAVEFGYEGFILRRDCELKSGRSRDLLKLKPYQDAEFKVIDYEIGPMRVFNDLGMEQSEQVLSSVTIDFDGNKVNVGSGFSIAERREFAKDPLKILNKIITVRYQNESQVEGREGKSLRFPIFKTLHGEERGE